MNSPAASSPSPAQTASQEDAARAARRLVAQQRQRALSTGEDPNVVLFPRLAEIPTFGVLARELRLGSAAAGWLAINVPEREPEGEDDGGRSPKTILVSPSGGTYDVELGMTAAKIVKAALRDLGKLRVDKATIDDFAAAFWLAEGDGDWGGPRGGCAWESMMRTMVDAAIERGWLTQDPY